MASETNLRSIADRIDVLMQEISTVADPVMRAKASELLEHVMRFYGAGLERILEIVDEQPEDQAEQLFGRFSSDPAIATMLLLHGLHPVDIETRVQQALDSVRPYLESHGGGVTVLGIDDGVLRLKLEGTCDGCQASAITMKTAVEKAVFEAAPDIIRVDAEGSAKSHPAPSLVQIGSAPASRGAATALSA